MKTQSYPEPRSPSGIGHRPAPAKRVEVVEEAEVSVKILASAIVSISEGMKRLRNSSLSDRGHCPFGVYDSGECP